MAADTLNRLFKFSKPRKVVRRLRRHPEYGETPFQVHASAPEQCLARLTASAALGFAYHPRIFGVQVLQVPVLDRIGITVRIPSACNCFISATAW